MMSHSAPKIKELCKDRQGYYHSRARNINAPCWEISTLSGINWYRKALGGRGAGGKWRNWP